MKSPVRSSKSFTYHPLIALLFVIVTLVLGCSKEKSAATVGVGQHAAFATPDEAGQALQAASKTQDEDALAKILGADSKTILSSGDPAEDKAALVSFVSKYDRMNRWVTMTDGSRVLYIGADNYVFPIPLAQDSSSKWYFNTASGKDEILARRIGKNELLAIDTLSVLSDAETGYFKAAHDGSPAHQYAGKILSTPGKRDGLYWEASTGQPLSPLGQSAGHDRYAFAVTQPGGSPTLDGYSFRILTAQGDQAEGGDKNYVANGKMSGGFAVLATPVTYGDSGIMTFILSREGVVYQKDLGKNTADAVASINSYNPDEGWTEAE
jgi:Protein of unknown function (DUF2950)